MRWLEHNGYDLLDGLPSAKEYDYCVWKGVDPELHPYGACFHDIEEKLSTGLMRMVALSKCRYSHCRRFGNGLLCEDNCFYSCLKAGLWKVIVNQAACRGIAPETVESAWQEMHSAGAIILENAEEIRKYINNQLNYIFKFCCFT